MKIRTSFVSNSSSSSFIFMGAKVPIETIKEKKNIWFCGDQLSDGWDMIPLDEDMIESVLKNKLLFSVKGYPFYEVFFSVNLEATSTHEEYSSENYSFEVTKANTPDKFEIFEIDTDYHRSSSLSDFEDRYILDKDYCVG